MVEKNGDQQAALGAQGNREQGPRGTNLQSQLPAAQTAGCLLLNVLGKQGGVLVPCPGDLRGIPHQGSHCLFFSFKENSLA